MKGRVTIKYTRNIDYRAAIVPVYKLGVDMKQAVAMI